MLERATAKSPGGGGRDHPLKLGPEAGSLLPPALLRWNDSMEWPASQGGGCACPYRIRLNKRPHASVEDPCGGGPCIPWIDTLGGDCDMQRLCASRGGRA